MEHSKQIHEECKLGGCNTLDIRNEPCAVCQASLNPSTALQQLDRLSEYTGKKGCTRFTKNKTVREHMEFSFDFARYNERYPHPLAVKKNAVHTNRINVRKMKHGDVHFNKKVTILWSEMDTCKTGVVIDSLRDIAFQCGKSLDTLRILSIIPRTMFGKSTVGRFGASGFDFQHYEEKGYFGSPGP